MNWRWITMSGPARCLTRLACAILVFPLAAGFSGCGILGRNGAEEETRFVTRGQQPFYVASQDSTAEAQQHVARARDHYARGNLQDAERELRAAREADASLAGADELQARIALDRGDMAAYRDTLQKMLAANPESAAVQNGIGKRLVGCGEWQAGTVAMSRALELAPRNVEYARDLASACLENSDSSTAADVLRRALQRNPRDTELLIVLARILESAENWPEAAVYYDLVLKSDPHNLAWRRQLARCLYRAGDYARSCDVYSSCIESDASRVALSEYAEFGDACLRTNQVERAQMAYDHIAVHSPATTREVEVLRVVCAIRLNDSDRARRILQPALAAWPDDVELRELADVVEQSGR